MTNRPTALGDCIATLADAIALGTEREAARLDLGPNELAFLKLFERREEWTASQVVDSLSLDPSQVSRLVGQLADRRLLRRRRTRTDRRVVRLTLTPKGSELINMYRDHVANYEAYLLADVSTQEISGFLSTTHKIIDRQEQYRQVIDG